MVTLIVRISTGQPDVFFSQDRAIHQQLVDLSTAIGMTQIQEQPTYHGNNLDLVFTTNPSLIKSTSVIPGISDHDIVVVDSLIRPHNTSRP